MYNHDHSNMKGVQNNKNENVSYWRRVSNRKDDNDFNSEQNKQGSNRFYRRNGNGSGGGSGNFHRRKQSTPRSGGSRNSQGSQKYSKSNRKKNRTPRDSSSYVRTYNNNNEESVMSNDEIHRSLMNERQQQSVQNIVMDGSENAISSRVKSDEVNRSHNSDNTTDYESLESDVDVNELDLTQNSPDSKFEDDEKTDEMANPNFNIHDAIRMIRDDMANEQPSNTTIPQEISFQNKEDINSNLSHMITLENTNSLQHQYVVNIDDDSHLHEKQQYIINDEHIRGQQYNESESESESEEFGKENENMYNIFSSGMYNEMIQQNESGTPPSENEECSEGMAKNLSTLPDTIDPEIAYLKMLNNESLHNSNINLNQRSLSPSKNALSNEMYMGDSPLPDLREIITKQTDSDDEMHHPHSTKEMKQFLELKDNTIIMSDENKMALRLSPNTNTHMNIKLTNSSTFGHSLENVSSERVICNENEQQQQQQQHRILGEKEELLEVRNLTQSASSGRRKETPLKVAFDENCAHVSSQSSFNQMIDSSGSSSFERYNNKRVVQNFQSKDLPINRYRQTSSPYTNSKSSEIKSNFDSSSIQTREFAPIVQSSISSSIAIGPRRRSSLVRSDRYNQFEQQQQQSKLKLHRNFIWAGLFVGVAITIGSALSRD